MIFSIPFIDLPMKRYRIGKVWVNHFEMLVAQHRGLPGLNCVNNDFC